MAPAEDKGGDFYAVLGLGKECSDADLKNAYRKLAMRWHPDRCSGLGVSRTEEATLKFQEIQEAYSALSDPSKRYLYDLGVEDDYGDVHEYGMDDFLDEMASMMNKKESKHKTAQDSFAELQDMFAEMVLADMDATSNYKTTDSSFSYNSAKNNPFGYTATKDSSNRTSNKKGFNSTNTTFCFGSTESRNSSVKGGSGTRRKKNGKK